MKEAATGRYLLFAPWPVRPGSGVNNVICGLAREAGEQYGSAIVVTGWGQAPPSEQHWLKLAPPSLAARKLPGFALRFLPNVLRLWRLTRDAAAVNPHYFGNEVLPIALLRRIGAIRRLILSVHGADVTEAAQGSAFDRRIYRWICGSADAVVACSQALAGEVRTLSPGARVTAVWNGVSVDETRVGPRPIDCRYLVSVAAFVEKKAHDVLVAAFRQIAEADAELKLVLIGADGPTLPRVEQLVKEFGLEGRVIITRDLTPEQTQTWVRYATCFVHAARQEPFGLAILEAALLGTPVVATAVGGIPEFLEDGVHGLTVERDNPEQFAAAVHQVLEDPRAAGARAEAFQEQARGFTWAAAWEKYRLAAGLL